MSNPNVKKHLLVVWGDVEPEILGPYDDEESREARAVELKREHGDEHGIFRLSAEVIGAIEVSAFSNGFFYDALGADFRERLARGESL